MIDNHMKIFGQIAFQFICEKFMFTALKYLHLKLNQDKEVPKNVNLFKGTDYLSSIVYR